MASENTGFPCCIGAQRLGCTPRWRTLLTLLAIALFTPLAWCEPGAEVFVQLGHRSSITSVSVTPSGQRVATASLDGLVKLWDPASGRELKTMEGHQGSVSGVALSPDGRSLASVGRDRTLRLWDTTSGKVMHSVQAHDNIVLAVAFSADGREVLTSGLDRLVKWWDPAKATALGQLEAQSAPARALALSSTGDRLAVGTEDGLIRIYQFPQGKRLGQLQGHRNAVLGLAFSPDGLRLASAGQDGTVRVWDPVRGAEVQQLGDSQWPATSVAYAPDGLTIASSSRDGLVYLWDSSGGTPARPLRGHGAEVNALAFASATGMLVSAGADRSARVWTPSDPSYLERMALRSRAIESRTLALTPDARTLATAGQDGQIRLWDLSSGRLLRSIAAHRGPIDALAFSPNGRWLSSGGNDKEIRLWDWAVGQTVRVLSGHRGGVMSLAFAPDGRTLASGSFDTSIRVWDVERGQVLRELAGHKSSVRALAFSPDGTRLASGGYDDSVRLWDTSSGAALKTWNDHTNRVTSVSFSLDGRHLVSGGEDSSVRVRDAHADAPARVLSGHAGPVRAVTPAGPGRVASASVDGTLVLWDLARGERVSSQALGMGQLLALAQAGPLLLPAGDAGAVAVLSVDSGNERGRLFSFADGHWVSITPEGFFHASPGGDRYLSVRLQQAVHGLDQFQERFYSPDRMRQALLGSDADASDGRTSPSPLAGARTSTMAQVRPAPVVALQNLPRDWGSDSLTVDLLLSDTGGGIGDIRLYLNGSAVIVESGHGGTAEGAGNRRRYQVRLVEGRNTLRAVAFNADNSMQSAEATHEVEVRVAQARRPSVHALVVGIGQYQNPKLNLDYSVADARLFADVLKETTPGLFENLHLRLLTTPTETTRDAVTVALQGMQRQVSPQDLFIFYVASHGTVDDNEYFLVTSNVGSTSTNRLRQDAIAQNHLKELLGNIPATKKLIVLDTCNSGQMLSNGPPVLMTRGLSEDRATKVLARSVGSTVLSAATSQQEAVEGYQGHGLFTWVLAQGLRGQADADRDGYVKTTEIADYVDNMVPDLAEQVFKHRQYPVTSPSGQQFPLARVKAPGT
jgi:WD40 repeat protein